MSSSRYAAASGSGLRVRLIGLDAPRPRVGRRHRYWVALLSLLAAALLVAALRAVSRAEHALVAQGARAARVVTYALAPGQQLQVAIEPTSEVFRVVLHAMRAGVLVPGAHKVRMTAAIHGALVKRLEPLALYLPSTVRRATLEQGDGVVGDPLGVHIDVRGVGAGELTLRLDAADGVDAVLLRVYRRDSISPLDALRRRAQLKLRQRERLARRVGQLDWSDLDEATRAELVGGRWRKAVPVPDAEHPLQARVIVLAPPAPARAAPRRPLSVFKLQGGRRAALIARGPNHLLLRARHDLSAPLLATLRTRAGAERFLSGRGELTLDVEAGQDLGVELEAPAATSIALYAASPERIELPSRLLCYRTTPERSALVVAGASALVLRVTARRPVSPTLASATELELNVAIDSPGEKPIRQTLAATVARSRFDRYTRWSAEFAPSERAVFYVLVPPRGRVVLGPHSGMLDLSLAELDPAAPPRAARTFPVDAEPSHVDPPDVPAWKGFVTRRPTNAAVFEPRAYGTLRIARRFGSQPPAEAPAAVRIARPALPRAIQRHHWLFQSASVPLHFYVRPQQRAALRLRLYAERAVQVQAHIDGAAPRRNRAGTASKITTSRTLRVEGEVRVTLVLGDDLAPGRHTLSLSSVPDGPLFVHLPWTRRRRSKPRATGWVFGDFAP